MPMRWMRRTDPPRTPQEAQQHLAQGRDPSLLSRLLYRAITPVKYGTREHLGEIPANLVNRRMAGPEREDAWRLYLGLPQEQGTFDVSQFQPGQSQENKPYYGIRDFWRRSFGSANHADLPDASVLANLEQAAHPVAEGWTPVDVNMGVMGAYKLGKGADERGPYFSYYDRWDLDKNPIEGREGRFGKPFEIYGRLYYDPERKVVHWPKENRK